MGRNRNHGDRKRKRDEVGRPESGTDAASQHYAGDKLGAPEAERYTEQNLKIQREMTLVALHLLDLKKGSLLLDAGCGSGLSMKEVLSDGYRCIGLDASAEMLNLAPADCRGALARTDLGQGLPFRPGMFDGVVSISALQWLLQTRDPQPALRFFESVHRALRPGAPLACQLYPPSAQDADELVALSQRVFPAAGFVAAAPHGNRAIKLFLVSPCPGDKDDTCPVAWPYSARCLPSEAMSELHRRHLRRLEGAVTRLQEAKGAHAERSETSKSECLQNAPTTKEIVGALLASENAPVSDAVSEFIRLDPIRACSVVEAELERCKNLRCFQTVVFRCIPCGVEVKNQKLLDAHLNGGKHRAVVEKASNQNKAHSKQAVEKASSHNTVDIEQAVEPNSSTKKLKLKRKRMAENSSVTEGSKET